MKKLRGKAFFRTTWLTLLSFASMAFSFAIQSGIAIVLCMVVLPFVAFGAWVVGKSQIG